MNAIYLPKTLPAIRFGEKVSATKHPAEDPAYRDGLHKGIEVGLAASGGVSTLLGVTAVSYGVKDKSQPGMVDAGYALGEVGLVLLTLAVLKRFGIFTR